MFATAGDKKKIQSVLDKLNGHFEPLKSEVLDQLKFLRRHQQPGESFDSWVVCLRGLVHIVDVSKACDIVRACEESRAQLTQMVSYLNIHHPEDSLHHLADKSVKRGPSASGGARPKTYSGGAILHHQLLDDCSGCGRHHAKN